MDAARLEPIPGPPGHLLVGNLFDVDADRLIGSLADLARRHGPIYRIEVPGRGSHIIVSGHALVGDLCDDIRFDKKVGPGLDALAANPASRGLFTAETSDPNWRKAHNVLMPAFSLGAMHGYFPQLLDVAQQLVQKWERLNPDDAVDVPADMTRLTLDTIALCGFGYRFNSFYRDTPHPFVVAMLGVLEASQAQMRELPIQARLRPGRARQLGADRQVMTRTVQSLIERRRASGTVGAVGDLLDRMLTGVDPQSGERLDDANVVAQCITFLVAGHETTSGLLSFALYALLKHPAVLARCTAEVDGALGRDLTVPPTYAQVHGLRYVAQVLDETLRLWPTAPAFTRSPYKDTVIGGKYQLKKGSPAVILTGMLHRDEQVWGSDPEAFDPDRFSPEGRAKIPPNAYKPFGTGQRACIGRQFALQEATLVLALILQHFDLLDFTDYRLETKQTLTIKPSNFNIRVKLRDRPAMTAPLAAELPGEPADVPPSVGRGAHQTPLLVLYGSNLGTAEGLARAVAEDGRDRGFLITTGTLDDHAGALPTEGGVIIVTASYNGQPPDNAAGFCRWLRDPLLARDALAGVRYAVFGCGNRDWAATYQAVPALIAAQLEKHGATPMCARGEGDARGDLDADYRAWHGRLWPFVAATLRLSDGAAQAQACTPGVSAASVASRANDPVAWSHNALSMIVRANRELQRRDGVRPTERSTRHLELGLPANATYGAGDHLAIVPRNNPEQVRRALLRFKPAADFDLVGTVELQSVATRAHLAALADYAWDDAQRRTLLALATDDENGQARYREQVAGPRRSVLDLLDRFTSCAALPFEVFLGLLPPLRPRYYSISSSPLVSPDACSITVGVMAWPADDRCGTAKGTCSNYLAAQPVGATVQGFVRKPSIPFRPPGDPRAPMIMVGCGTGLAPYRGFLQERAALQEQGAPVGEAMLFFGCRDPLQDFLYEDELRAYEAAGITRLLPAFSREPCKPRTYVQQVIETESEAVWRLLRQDAVVYVCGEASGMAPAVRQAFADVVRQHAGASAADAQAWLAKRITRHHYLEDVWASAT